MTSAIARLLAAASPPLITATPVLASPAAPRTDGLFAELANLLRERNGFFAFGPALHVFPTEATDWSWGLEGWNDAKLWKHEFQSFVDPGFCFAEDLVGNQFCILDDRVQYFAVETGKMEPLASSIEDWANLILEDDQFWTAWPIAEKWAERHGPVPPRRRLHPATPFVCGGTYEIDNLRAVNAAEMMGYWGNFARQIRALPDGTQIGLAFGKLPN